MSKTKFSKVKGKAFIIQGNSQTYQKTKFG